jgi:hypothetical protein
MGTNINLKSITSKGWRIMKCRTEEKHDIRELRKYIIWGLKRNTILKIKLSITKQMSIIEGILLKSQTISKWNALSQQMSEYIFLRILYILFILISNFFNVYKKRNIL